MKKLMFVLLCLVFYGCEGCRTGGTSAAQEEGTAGDTAKNVITFKVDGAVVTTTAWNIARFKFANMTAPGLNITSNMHEEKRTVRFNLAGYQPGVYMLDGSPLEGGSYGSYMPDYWQRGVTFPITGGRVVLTEVDTVRKVVNGTFYFTATRAGDTVKITDGKIINGKLDVEISGVGK